MACCYCLLVEAIVLKEVTINNVLTNIKDWVNVLDGSVS